MDELIKRGWIDNRESNRDNYPKERCYVACKHIGESKPFIQRYRPDKPVFLDVVDYFMVVMYEKELDFFLEDETKA